MSTTGLTASAVPSSAPASAPPGRATKIGVLVVVTILVIFAVVQWRKLANSPAGKAIKALLGALGAVIISMLNNPILWLIGIGLAYTLGPTLLKLAGSAMRRLAKRIRGASEDDANKDQSEQPTDDQVELRTEKLVEAARIETTNDNEKLDQAGREDSVKSAEARYASARAAFLEGEGNTEEDATEMESEAADQIKNFPDPSSAAA